MSPPPKLSTSKLPSHLAVWPRILTPSLATRRLYLRHHISTLSGYKFLLRLCMPVYTLNITVIGLHRKSAPTSDTTQRQKAKLNSSQFDFKKDQPCQHMKQFIATRSHCAIITQSLHFKPRAHVNLQTNIATKAFIYKTLITGSWIGSLAYKDAKVTSSVQRCSHV